jgi:hypothetical protein
MLFTDVAMWFPANAVRKTGALPSFAAAIVG